MMPLVVLVLVAFVCGISWAWLLQKLKISSLTPPPGPPALPFLGHLHLLMRGYPHHVLLDLSRKYGAIFSIKLGSVPVVVVSDSKSAKAFLKTHDVSFASRPPTMMGQLLTYNSSDIALGPYGDRWRQLRRIAMLELFTTKRLETFQQQRMEEIQFMLESVSNSVSNSVVSKVDLRKVLQQLTFNITTRMIMSKRYFGHNVEDTKEAEEFMHVIDEIFELGGSFSVGEYLPYLRWLDVDGIERRFKAVGAETDSFLERIICNRVNKRQQSVGPLVDFVDIMLQLRDKGEEVMQGNSIKAVMFNLITGGTDTSSVTAEWALAELIKQPSLLSKAQDEIAKVVGATQLVEEGHLSQMPLLQSIIKETFRLHPAVPLLLPHKAIENCKVMEYDIAAGNTVIINAYAIQRDPSIWEDALLFKPERFLDSQVDVRGHDFELIPFGSGRRMCPAMSLGLTKVQLAVANLLHAFDWEVPPGDVVDTVAEKYGLTVPPAKRLELLCHPRLPVDVYKSMAS